MHGAIAEKFSTLGQAKVFPEDRNDINIKNNFFNSTFNDDIALYKGYSHSFKSLIS